MRLLHTSDLHLGQNFLGKSRQAEHDGFFCWLVEQVRERSVDVVVVAGDVFDTGTPPSYAREQYLGFIDAFFDTGAQLVVLGGNHDSPAMLGESRLILARVSTLVIPEIAVSPADQVHVVPRRDGSPGLILCGIPFIRSRDVAQSEAGQGAEDKRLALMNGISQHYARIHEAALAKRAELGLELPIVTTGHLTTVGASISDSVREIYVGSLSAFPSNAFPPADYIALGHIHRPQSVGGHEHIRYCGSPIPLSFDESGQDKQVVLVEFDGAQRRSIEAIAVPNFQPMARVRGSLDALPSLLASVAAGASKNLSVWVEVTVDTDDYLPDIQARVDGLAVNLPIDILRIRRARNAEQMATLESQPDTLGELKVQDVFERRLKNEPDLSPERLARLRERFAEVAAELDDGEAG